jgi:tRNA G10  N-methylase Trm11
VIQAGQPVPISPDARNKLEASVRAWSDMGVKRDGAESEVWAYTRRADPRAWLLHRLDSPSKRSAARGSLKPDLAAALLRAEPISPSDVFLDGFAGSGSIAAARAHSPCSRIEICESDSDAVKRLRQRGKRGDFGRSFTIHHSDIRQLLARGLVPGSIDVAVLDPPWGEFDDSLDDVSLTDLYEGTCKMLSEALRVGGRAVFLVSQKTRSLDTLDLGGLEIVSSHNALVNGKKARIVRMTRLGGPVREPA